MIIYISLPFLTTYNCQKTTIPFGFILWDRSGMHCTFSLKIREVFIRMHYDKESLEYLLTCQRAPFWYHMCTSNPLFFSQHILPGQEIRIVGFLTMPIVRCVWLANHQCIIESLNHLLRKR